MNENDLPRLTQQQQKFLLYYFSHGKNASEAYRYAYESKAKASNVWSEASKLLKNPKVTPWVEYYTANQQETIKNEVKYSAQECFNNLLELQKMAIESKDKNSNPNLNAAIKAEELKGKLGNLFKEKLTLETGDKFSLFMTKVEEKAQKLDGQNGDS
jgi:phage terminase small subunit